MHRAQVLGRIDAHIVEQRQVGRLGAVGSVQHRVAVRLGVRHRLGADHAAGAGPVLHHHRLAQDIGQLARQQARLVVGDAGGRERHDQREAAAGVVLRAGLRRDQKGGRGHGQKCFAPVFHFFLLRDSARTY
jgi:hypothetical protein